MKIKNIHDFIATQLGIDTNLINQETSYQSIPEWDSFRHVNLMLKLEQAYGVQINEKDILALTTVGAIEKFVNSYKHEQPHIISNKKNNTKKIYRGLDGIFFDNTTITSIDGKKGKLLYRGYAIEELAKFSSYEEVCYLLIFGVLPKEKEFSQFKKCLAEKRSLSNATMKFISNFKELNHVDMTKSFLSMYSSLEFQTSNSLQASLGLISKVPLVIAYQKCFKENSAPHETITTDSLAKNFLSLITKKHPDPEDVKMLEQVMVIHADHGSSASSFVARITASTGASFHSAVVAAISTFSGNLHGGALEEVIHMLEEIGKPENASIYIRKKIESGQPIYGYGHRIYRTQDPRAKIMRALAKKISLKYGDTRYFDVLEAINAEMEEHTKYGVNVNVDFYAVVIYHFLGIPHDMFVAVFIMSRVIGWAAQILEQESNNILIRPRLNYIGRKEEKYIPIHERTNN